MGLFYSDIWRKWFSDHETKLLMVGLDMAGKTTILNELKLQKYIKYIEYIGFSIESIQYKNFVLNCWDVGGQETPKLYLKRQYYNNVQGIIFVVDSSNFNRMEEAGKIIKDLLKIDELNEAILLVYANKQDDPKSLKPQELENRLNLKSILDREWYVQGSCGENGDGLYEGLNWLGEKINKKFK